MKVYEVTVTDRDTGAEPTSCYESYVAVGSPHEVAKYNDYLPDGISDEDIHYYFENDEWENGLHDGEIETDEFKYIVGGEY